VDVELLDLSDLDSVRAFGKKAREERQPLDVLLNNAGSAHKEE
jgi:NAD(P)-dependent dehydrogenase (short-subunit alcohol dehydrogenase family)